MNKQFDDSLIRLLEAEVTREKWKKKLRITGKVVEKKTSRKGSYILTIKTKRNEYKVVVPQHRRKEFETASGIVKGDTVKAVGKRSVGVVFCDRIEKSTAARQKEKQLSLTGA